MMIVPRTAAIIVRSSNLARSVANGYLYVAISANAHETTLSVVALGIIVTLLLD